MKFWAQLHSTAQTFNFVLHTLLKFYIKYSLKEKVEVLKIFLKYLETTLNDSFPNATVSLHQFINSHGLKTKDGCILIIQC